MTHSAEPVAPRRARVPLHVLFVCTGNICRSPYAELRAREVWAAADVTMSSAGVRGYAGRAMDPVMAAELRRRGGDATAFRSHRVGADDLARADLVVVFEFSQQMRLWELAPSARAKIFGLAQLTAAAEKLGLIRATSLPKLHRVAHPNSMTDDIDDPYKRGPKHAAQCANLIDGYLRRIATMLPPA